MGAKTVTTTVTKTVGKPVVWKPPEKIKAAWIYVGPIGDFGWTYMHDIGRRVAQELFKDWLVTDYKESVKEAKLLEVIDDFVAKGFNVFFTTSFEFMDKTIEAGATIAQQIIQEGITEGSVVQIDAESGRVVNLGLSLESTKGRTYEIDTRKKVPRPTGKVLKEKEFVKSDTIMIIVPSSKKLLHIISALFKSNLPP